MSEHTVHFDFISMPCTLQDEHREAFCIEHFEPFYFSLYSVIFHGTILFFLLGYSNCSLSRECWRNPITQKKPAIQRILNTPMGQTPCIAGFLDTNNKRVDRSIVSMLRSIFDKLGLYL